MSGLEAAGLDAGDEHRLADERLKAEAEHAHRDYLALPRRRGQQVRRRRCRLLRRRAGRMGMPDCEVPTLVAHELAAPGTNPSTRGALAAAGRWWSRGPCVTVAAGEEE